MMTNCGLPIEIIGHNLKIFSELKPNQKIFHDDQFKVYTDDRWFQGLRRASDWFVSKHSGRQSTKQVIDLTYVSLKECFESFDSDLINNSLKVLESVMRSLYPDYTELVDMIKIHIGVFSSNQNQNQHKRKIKRQKIDEFGNEHTTEEENPEFYQKSADLGYTYAMFNLAICYEKGHGTHQDENKATQWYQKAAELGNVEAMFSLGWCYDCGQGTEKDYEKAVYWYQKAANLGHQNAMFNLALCYQNGTGILPDEKMATYWSQRSQTI